MKEKEKNEEGFDEGNDFFVTGNFDLQEEEEETFKVCPAHIFFGTSPAPVRCGTVGQFSFGTSENFTMQTELPTSLQGNMPIYSGKTESMVVCNSINLIMV